MRDVVAAILALLLLFVAASLAATLHYYRRSRERLRGDLRVRGQTIVAEIPADEGLKFFSFDDGCFYYGEHAIPKGHVRAVRVLVNGAPIAASVSRRFPSASVALPLSFEEQPEGIARDRWDVAIESPHGSLIVQCGAIRERVSQELAQKVFEAVKSEIESRDAT